MLSVKGAIISTITSIAILITYLARPICRLSCQLFLVPQLSIKAFLPHSSNYARLQSLSSGSINTK